MTDDSFVQNTTKDFPGNSHEKSDICEPKNVSNQTVTIVVWERERFQGFQSLEIFENRAQKEINKGWCRIASSLSSPCQSKVKQN